MRVNPMALASAGLLFASAVLPWMSLVTLAMVEGFAFPVFGLQVNLWDLAGPLAPISLKPIVALAAGLLVLSAAFAVLVRGRIGAALSLAGLLVFLGGTDEIFGAHAVGSALTIVAPGPGIEWAAAGFATAAFSYRFQSRSIADLVRGLRTRQVLAQLGLFLAVVFVAIDAVDHASGGDLFAVLGSGAMEFGLHAMFLATTAALASVYALRASAFRGRTGSVLIALAGLGLVLDGIYHATTGDVTDFAGHTDAEMLAHLATYYGVALLTISRFMLRGS